MLFTYKAATALLITIISLCLLFSCDMEDVYRDEYGYRKTKPSEDDDFWHNEPF